TNAPAVLGHRLLSDLVETARAVEQHGDVVARFQEHLAGQHRRARLGVALCIAVEHAAEAMAAETIADHHAVYVDEARVTLAEPAKVGTGVVGVLPQRDQETGDAAVDLGDA